MKRTQNIFAMGIAIMVALFALNACGVSGKATTANSNGQRPGDQEILVENPLSLIELISRAPGVFVNAGIPTVRGGLPLYVLDGIRQGHDFSSISGLVNINDVASVEVLTNPSETLRYGRDVANGVILIKTKSN